MSTVAGDLRELHQLHIRLREVQQELERGPKQIRARQQFTQRKQQNLEAQSETLTACKKAADQKSLQLKSNESRIADLKLKLNSASSNREYDILKGQIEADTMANSVLEDEILEALEKVDSTQQVIRQLEQEHQAAKQAEEGVLEAVTAAEPGLRQEAQELAASISEAEKTLPGDIAVDYRRLVKTHGAAALAPVENGACTECYVGLSPQSRVELNSGKILFCKNCGRLLYQPEE